jgi:two-component system, NarL family, nitrate/nitrite response regulator NarL
LSAENSSPTVLVATREPATRAGIRVASDADGIEVIGEVASVQELVEAVGRARPDICLIDLDLPGGGIRGAAEVSARAPDVAIVMLAEEADERQFLDALHAGAVGYILKSISAARLPDVLRAVVAGEPAVPRSLVVSLIDGYRDRLARRRVSGPRRGAGLTTREWEVFDFMSDGLTTREIATRLLISEVTVRRHIGSALKKLDVQSREEALKLLQSA